MKQAGQVVLLRFPQTDLAEGKLRPALMLGRLPGLKVRSVVRVGRLAVVESKILLGAAGEVAEGRFQRIKNRLASWIQQL